jgi:pimeloyl-ACP methyl ester carboxylesterase
LTDQNGAMSYLNVGDLSLYYETHGSGDPLVLLHGGLGAVEMFGDLVPTLAEHREVIGVDLQAHGRTADIDRPIRYESMADDVAALIGHLGYDGADVLGYSLGGGTALRLAIQHPDLVRRLVTVSVAHKREAWYPEVLVGMSQMTADAAEMLKQGPVYQLYEKIAPRVEDFPRLIGKVGDLLRNDYDWSAEVATLKPAVLLIFADADSISPVSIAEMYRLLGGGLRDAGWDGTGRPAAQLAVLPGATHYDILTSPLLAPAVTRFLA